MRRSRLGGRGVLLATALVAGGGLFASAACLADGKSQFAACVPCHGARGEGVSATGAPNIAGTAPWYVERQLKDFASGARGRQPGDTFGASMGAASATLGSDKDRASVAEYVAALPPVRTATTITPNDNGRNYFNAICSACHASNGLGNQTLGAPRLAGVEPTYLARQLAAFKSGRRGAQNGDRLGAQMRAISAMLPDARTERDVIAYAASLKP